MASTLPADETSDLWTTDQESALLKAVVSYKPVGLHAHFRMLAIRNFLVQSGTIDPEAAHTRIPGIWAKLRTLYDLPRLDDREDAVFTSLDEGKGSAGKGHWRDFELVGGGDGEQREVFEALMWERRLAPEGSSGEEEDEEEDGSGEETGKRRGERGRTGSVAATTDEPRSSPVPSTMGRGMRSGGRKGRVNRLKDETMDVDSSPVGSARASRRTSKAMSEVDEDQLMEDVDAVAADEDEDEVNDSEDGSDEAESERRGSVVRRGRGGRRGRGKRGRRRG